MIKTFVVGCLFALACTVAIDADAKSCPPGQILRVSSGVCQPKSAENLSVLKSSVKRTDKSSAVETSSGAVVVFGSAPSRKPTPGQQSVGGQPGVAGAHAPNLTLPHSVLRQLVRAPAAEFLPEKAMWAAAEKRAAASASSPTGERASPASPAKHQPPKANVDERSTAATAPAKHAPEARASHARPAAIVARPEQLAPSDASPQIDAELNGERQPSDKTPAPDRVGSIPRAGNTASTGKPGETTQSAKQIGASGKGAQVAAPVDPPPAGRTESLVTMSAAIAEPVQQATTTPRRRDPDASEPTDPSSGLPDWGDKQIFVSALRANWKGAPVTQRFEPGSSVPPDLPLERLPEPFANRDSGVNMHYLISNDDAVLVLPRLRVVVDVFSGAAASLAGR